MENVHFVTLQDYNSMYLANDTIDSIVAVNSWIREPEDFAEFFSIEEYILQNQSSIGAQYFEFKLLSPPGESLQIAQFKVIYELVNGESFETSTDEIVLGQ